MTASASDAAVSAAPEPHANKPLRLTLADLRLLGTCVAGLLVLACMTGPSGSSAAPTSGLKDSLLAWRVIPFIIGGVVLWALMTTFRKVRSGELSGLAAARHDFATWCSTTWDHALRDTAWRRAIGAITFVLTLIGALVVAAFTGPYHPDKLSVGWLAHQLTQIYSLGYLLLAVVLWVVLSRRVLERHGLRISGTARRGALHATLVVLGCLAGGLLLAFSADPWVSNASFHLSYLRPSSQASIFRQWPTYVYLAASLLVALRILRIEGKRPRMMSQQRRPSLMTPQVSLALYVTALFVAVEAPKFMPSYWQSEVATGIAVFALLALGLNVVVGYSGLLDLGYVAFYAVGAYTAAFFVNALPHAAPHRLSLFVIIPIAVGAAMVAGVLLGLPTLRVRGDYLAIVTLGFGQIIEVVLTNWTTVTRGGQGTFPIPTFDINIFGIHYHWNNADPMPYYYLILGFIIVAIFMFSSLNRSRVGRRWASIREDEHAAASVGVSPLKYKVMSFAIGASTAGFAGVFTASASTSLFPYPQTFGLQLSILILALVIFGGMGSMVGVLVGAAFFYWLQLYLQLHPFPGYNISDYYMYIGALFILLMIFRPQGLIPSRRRAREISLAEQGVGFADVMGVERLAESDQFEHPREAEGVFTQELGGT